MQIFLCLNIKIPLFLLFYQQTLLVLKDTNRVAQTKATFFQNIPVLVILKFTHAQTVFVLFELPTMDMRFNYSGSCCQANKQAALRCE